METEFHKKYEAKIEGTISCYDRMIISGSLTRWGHADAMTAYVVQERMKFTDFPKFALQINEQIRGSIAQTAASNAIRIEHISSPGKFNKEKEIQKRIGERGDQEGILAIFSSMEICDGYHYQWNGETQRGKITYRTSKCLYYYLYFIDKALGLCFLRIPTWLPCRLEFYCNGHNLLSRKLQKAGIDYTMEDNAFTFIDDYQKAQGLSDDLRVKDLHKWLDIFANRYIPFLRQSQQSYRWTITQIEYATDIIFKRAEDLRLLYDEIILKSIHTVKPGNIATFFSRALAAHYSGEVTTRYNKLIQGTRIKHTIGANSLKMYDKAPRVLRIETTINHVSDFKVFREVQTRNNGPQQKYAKMKKTIYSLYDLAKQCRNINARYLDFIASFDDTSNGKKNLQQITRPVIEQQRSYRGFNVFDPFDEEVLVTLASGEFNIHGFRNKDIRARLSKQVSSSAMSRIIKRLHLHGLIKKINKTFKYYLTKLGRRTVLAALEVKHFTIIPSLV